MRFLTLCVFLVVFGAKHAIGQDITVRLGHVVYTTIKEDQDSVTKKKYAELCEEFCARYYSTKRLPFVYLVISSTGSDTSLFELAFDNLRGNSLSNREYGRNKIYDVPGIRIKICTRERKEEEVLKLLDYAINHLMDLKNIRKRAVKKDEDASLSLGHDKIMSILNGAMSDKVSDFINNKNFR